MLNQISLFTENNKGGLFKITTILAKANINIYTMLANDSAEFGIVRLIVDKAETAIEVLNLSDKKYHGLSSIFYGR